MNLFILFICATSLLPSLGETHFGDSVQREHREDTCKSRGRGEVSFDARKLLSVSESQRDILGSLAKLRRLVVGSQGRTLAQEDVLNEFGESEPHCHEEDLLMRVTDFVNALIAVKNSATGAVARRYYEEIIVIGAGPAGLINAIVARINSPISSAVKVYEKRSADFDRDVWFDISSTSVNALSYNHESLGFLRSLGLQYMLDLNSTKHTNLNERGGEVETMPCSGLQRFLEKVLYVLGAEVKFGVSGAEIDTLLGQNDHR